MAFVLRDPPKSLICIPTYNEKDNVEALAQAIFSVVPAATDILFVDDGSPDGTGQILDRMAQGNSRVHVLHRKGKLGLATAYLRAFEWALGSENKYDLVFEMDADFSHDPEHLAQFFGAYQKGFDAICGSRYVPGGGVSNWDRRRLVLSQGGSLYSRIWLQYPMRDWTGGFNAWSVPLLKRLCLSTIRSKGYAFQIELKYRALELGARLVEVPIVFRERRAGASKMSGSIVKEALLGVAAMRLRAGTGKLFL